MRSVRAKCAETTAAGSVTLSPPKTPQSTARALKKVGQGLGTIAFLFIPTWRGITGGIMQSASLSRRNFFRLCTGTFGGLTLLRKDQPRFQVGLDVGCSKIVIAVVEHRSGFRPRLLSANAVPSHSVTHHGNLRAWPFEENRSDSKEALSAKLKDIDQMKWSLISEQNIRAFSHGDEARHNVNAAKAFCDSVHKRYIFIYKEWYESTGIAALLPEHIFSKPPQING